MNKKFSLGITISLIAIACAITFVLTVTVSTNMFNEKIAGINEREGIYTKIQEIDTYVRNSSLYTINEENLLNSIVKGYVSGLKDSDAYYLTADEYYKYQQVEKGVIIGAGIEAEREESGYIKISYIYPGSPAEEEEIPWWHEEGEPQNTGWSYGLYEDEEFDASAAVEAPTKRELRRRKKFEKQQRKEEKKLRKKKRKRIFRLLLMAVLEIAGILAIIGWWIEWLT